jgi:hypothetical protein
LDHKCSMAQYANSFHGQSVDHFPIVKMILSPNALRYRLSSGAMSAATAYRLSERGAESRNNINPATASMSVNVKAYLAPRRRALPPVKKASKPLSRGKPASEAIGFRCTSRSRPAECRVLRFRRRKGGAEIWRLARPGCGGLFLSLLVPISSTSQLCEGRPQRLRALGSHAKPSLLTTSETI